MHSLSEVLISRQMIMKHFQTYWFFVIEKNFPCLLMEEIRGS